MRGRSKGYGHDRAREDARIPHSSVMMGEELSIKDTKNDLWS